jgi:hypothetical protein
MGSFGVVSVWLAAVTVRIGEAVVKSGFFCDVKSVVVLANHLIGPALSKEVGWGGLDDHGGMASEFAWGFDGGFFVFGRGFCPGGFGFFHGFSGLVFF